MGDLGKYVGWAFAVIFAVVILAGVALFAGLFFR